MSGHSKWHSIKHKKGAADAARGKLFAVLIRQIEVAARTGGGDPATNATLRTMVQKARDNSLPVDTIQRAIKRGTGEEEGVIYESVTYEGYAPSGVAVIVQALTDNRNRTSAEIKNLFSRNGGSFAEPGAVSWQFERKGDRAGRQGGRRGRADAGRGRRRRRRRRRTAATRGRSRRRPPSCTRCAPRSRRPGFKVKSGDLTMIPTTVVELDQESQAKTVLRLMDVLEDHDDVEAVYANFDIPDAVLEAVTA